MDAKNQAIFWRFFSDYKSALLFYHLFCVKCFRLIIVSSLLQLQTSYLCACSQLLSPITVWFLTSICFDLACAFILVYSNEPNTLYQQSCQQAQEVLRLYNSNCMLFTIHFAWPLRLELPTQLSQLSYWYYQSKVLWMGSCLAIRSSFRTFLTYLNHLSLLEKFIAGKWCCRFYPEDFCLIKHRLLKIKYHIPMQFKH